MDWETTSALAAAGAALLPGSVGFLWSRAAGLPAARARAATAIAAIGIALFTLAFALQQSVTVSNAAWARALWVHAYDGFYLGTIQNRIVDRIWPASQARGASPRRASRATPLHLEGALR